MNTLYTEFENIANQYSNSIALVNKSDSISYKELLKKVLDFSQILNTQRQGVLLILPKSIDLIAWQLAISHSNNVFCTIDVLNPANRVEHILNQLKPHWIVSKSNPDPLRYKLVMEFEFSSVWKSTSNSLTYSEPASHVFFSSGSTGAPKGILLGIEGTLKVVKAQATATELKNSKKFAWFLSPGFDASMSDVYSTLLSGAELHICDFPQTKIKTLQNYLKSNKITHTDLSPSILPLLDFKELTSLESIVFGGEVGNEQVIRALSEKIKLFNAYGPTEASICTSFKRVSSSWTSNDIGVPWDFTNYHLSENSELFISGNVLALGYLDTSLNNKFLELNNTRYYKTGDVVEFHNETYLYKGRLDRQFKKNGVLISPEEIEAVALKLGCVLAKCDNKEGFSLYYDGNMAEKELRAALEAHLPIFMVPSKIIKTQSIKLNMNGKSQL